MAGTTISYSIFLHNRVRIIIFLMKAWLLLSVHMVTSLKYDFEYENETLWQVWDNEFIRVHAASVYGKDRPLVDATTGTGNGHYLFAEHSSHSNVTNRVLFSYCMPPTGPGCRFNFSTIIHTSMELIIGTWIRCDRCGDPFPSSPYAQKAFNSSGTSTQWRHYSMLLGVHPVTFEMTIHAEVPEANTYVALDDLELIDCEVEPAPIIDCPNESPLQCSANQQCLSADQLCDMHIDCPLCQEDEKPDQCELIPQGGYLKLQDCDFHAGECLWYNVHSHDGVKGDGTGQLWGWRVASTADQPLSNQSPEHAVQGKYLQVLMNAHTLGTVAILRSVSFQPCFSGGGLCQLWTKEVSSLDVPGVGYFINTEPASREYLFAERTSQEGIGVFMDLSRSARFWYRTTAKNAVLKLELVEVGRRHFPKPVREIWSNVSAAVDDVHGRSSQWSRVVVDLNVLPINVSYVLQFKAYSNSSDGEIGIHNISLSRECFHPALGLSTCGLESGPHGPTQEKCHLFYGNGSLVRVVETGPLRGVQIWTVPETMIYRIQAFGAEGGSIVFKSQVVKGVAGSGVTARFKLQKNDELHFLIGQMGDDACEGDGTGSGSAGGGATIVFKVNEGRKAQVLLVAAGGSGVPSRQSDSIRKSTTVTYETTTVSGSFYFMTEKDASQLLNTSLEGGLPCRTVPITPPCEGRGGFGGGGGGCSGGGFGGGADPLLAYLSMSLQDVSLPGRSYVHSSALSWLVEREIHSEGGAAELYGTTECECSYQCLWLDGDRFATPTCICPKDLFLLSDGVSCAAATAVQEEKDSFQMLLLIIIGSVVAVLVLLLCLCLYLQRHTLRVRHPTSLKKVTSFLCPCLNFSRRPLSAHVLPQIQRPPAVMHINPNYDVVTTKCPEQSLRELPRKHLKLLSELGQGAFGEVYFGLLSHVPMVEGDLPVAVKTLPPVCTEQTEMDFLMEAVIVSKFNHPNIVKFIGVCFEQHPHYLVLELLEGGDLKSFLRQGRPTWDHHSSLTILDLLRLSLDIARGCQHLEEKHFIHRDIAARNCLLTTKGPHRTAKIADFGMARDIYRSDYYKKAGKAMLPVKWMPPEAFLDGIFTSKTDVWSFGILMWEVFSLGHMPYPGCSNEEVMNLVTQGERLDPPEGCPSSVYDIIVSCWSGIPEGRPNFTVIIASLERALQDDDMVSRGLPVFYVPPIVNTRGLKLHERQIQNTPQVKNNTTNKTIHATNVAMSPNTSSDGYLEPLLTQSSKGICNDGPYRYRPDNSHSSTDRSMLVHSARDTVNGGVRAENKKLANKNASRAPRVFYKPGSNHYLSDGAATETLLKSQNSPQSCHLSQKDEATQEDSLNCDLCVNLNDTEGNNDSSSICDDGQLEDEDLKMGTAGALPEKEKKRKSYIHFPRPSS